MTSQAAAQTTGAAFWQAIAEGCDGEPLRYASFCADRMVLALAPRPGDKLLDVACGSGAVTLAAAQAVGPEGRVVAIDTAEPLLELLDAKLAKFGVANVDVHVMDGGRLDFRRDYFHHVVCSLAPFWLRDPHPALAEWRRVLRPGGELLVSCFAPGAFEPALGVLRDQLQAAGVPPAALVLPWDGWQDPQRLVALLSDAGYQQVTVQPVALGYHLKDARQWWEVVQYSVLRTLLTPLVPAQQAGFEAAHLAALAGLVGADGLPMDVNVFFLRGRKPGA
jgi:ubiquinone/menaquinone biosynthesis C-methylase UbiE